MIEGKEIEELLDKLDGSGSDREWTAAKKLRELGAELPRFLLQRYRITRGWKARSSCVYHTMRYARQSEDSVTLGKEALRDKSKVVRYRACMLLAYSQRRDALPHLREALSTLGKDPSSEDVRAAIDAIESRNHNYFIDRDHSGRVELNIN